MPEIFIQPIDSDNTDYDLYAKYTAKQWTQAVTYYRHFLESPENQDKLQQAIAKLQDYLSLQKQSPNYCYHTVTYIGFPLSLDDRDFVPRFRLEVSYGGNCVATDFLIK